MKWNEMPEINKTKHEHMKKNYLFILLFQRPSYRNISSESSFQPHDKLIVPGYISKRQSQNKTRQKKKKKQKQKKANSCLKKD